MATSNPIKGSERVPLPGAVATGRANPHATIEVTLKLRRKKALPAMTGRPAVAMTRQELGESYGASQEDIDKVVQTFGALGLQAVDVNPAARTVRLSGNIAAMEQAFQTRLFNYTHSAGNYRGRVGAVHVPAAVTDIVEGVFGLDNRQVAHRRRLPERSISHARMASVPSAWYMASELATHYNFPPGDGSGQTVGLLEFGGGYFSDDLAQYCSLANVPAPPKVTVVSTDGTPTDATDGAEAEVMLDVEVVAGLCPKANIVVYFAQFTEQGWISAIDAAVHDQTNNPGVLSVSWGYAEDNLIWTNQAMMQVNESFKDAAAVGVTICVAAGDDGSSDAVSDGNAHVDFPASSPYVLAVGGTTIPTKGGAQPDIVWKQGDGLRSDGGGSTGGGVSSVFPRPDWQKNITINSVNAGAIIGRCVPDLAANADWTASPYLLVVDGQQQPNGGTSAAAPLIASLLTRINAQRPAGKRVGYVTPALYQTIGPGAATIGLATCRNVASGDNITDQVGGYSAGPGYNAVAGWGTPDGMKLAQLLP